jgi:hypothetical protein
MGCPGSTPIDSDFSAATGAPLLGDMNSRPTIARRWSSVGLGALPVAVVLAACATGGPVDPSPGASSALGPAAASERAVGEPASGTQRIRLHIGDETAVATLDDTDMARALVAVLPLELDLVDTMGQALVGELPDPLDATDPGRTERLVAGAIYYWPPTGALAVVHTGLEPQVPPPGAVRLGVVSQGAGAFEEAGRRASVEIESVSDR